MQNILFQFNYILAKTDPTQQLHGLFATAELLVNLYISGTHGCMLTNLVAIIHHYLQVYMTPMT